MLVFEKFGNLSTALMFCCIIIMPINGAVTMYASDSLPLDTPIEIRNEYSPQTFEFEVGQHFDYEISKSSLIGTLSYEVKRVEKGGALIRGVFTYYIIIPGEDDPITLWDDPITQKKSFWIDGGTNLAHSQDYIALLWNNYIRDSLTNYTPNMEHDFGEDSSKYFSKTPIPNPPSIRKINREIV